MDKVSQPAPIENAPRYTSYPTAPHFHEGVGVAQHHVWLSTIPSGETVSLYLHIPYCDQICWFCACNTKHTTRYHVVETYLKSLYAEIATVAKLLRGRASVGAIHYGGGSPTMLKPADLCKLDATLRREFQLRADAEISIEIDPRDMNETRYDTLKAIGVNRASIGVQDFDPKVQAAINRYQSFDMTRQVVENLRQRGVESINLDLLYGLPFQTAGSVKATMAQALTLAPDRIALFGYAHVPWFKKQQTMIKNEWLPDTKARLDQFAAASDLVLARHYDAIGLDHFSLPPDALSLAARSGKLRRNFQGYTADRCTTLIGLGASAVSQFEQGYVQNATAASAYERLVESEGLAAVKGIALSDDDRIRGWLIQKLMCDFEFSSWDAYRNFGFAAKQVVAEAKALAANDLEEHIQWIDDSFRITQAGRAYVRSIAARFDTYLAAGKARHSAAV